MTLARERHPDAMGFAVSDMQTALGDWKGPAVWISQGNFYVTSRKELSLITVLGSCIAVCIRDPIAETGGLSHFLLPDSDPKEHHDPTTALLYGSYSIERLINAIISRGGRRDRLEVKVFGGANVISGNMNIGARNVDFVEHYFAKEKIPIKAADLRGTTPRKIRYFPATGRAFMSELSVDQTNQILRDENRESRKISSAGGGNIDLFVE